MRYIFIMLFFTICCLSVQSQTSVKTPNFQMSEMPNNTTKPYLTFNAAIELIDIFMQPTLKAYPADASPTVNDPTNGDLFIVPQDATGEWKDKDNKLAAMVNDDWVFVSPKNGWHANTMIYSSYLLGYTSYKVTYNTNNTPFWNIESEYSAIIKDNQGYTTSSAILWGGGIEAYRSMLYLNNSHITFHDTGNDPITVPASGYALLRVSGLDLIYTAKATDGTIKTVTLFDFSEAP